MKKNTVNSRLLQLLVSTYNQSIQTYFYFPEVIVCGQVRWDREDFDELLANDFLEPYKADSFGRWYRLSKTGEAFLFQASFRRRPKMPQAYVLPLQSRLPFRDCS
jgi:hypothetical protein